jgi:hypothetical protein
MILNTNSNTTNSIKKKSKMKDKDNAELTHIEKRVIKTAMDIRADFQPEDILYQHSVLCQTVLPYRDPGDEVKTWSRVNGNAFLGIQATEAFNPMTKEFEPVGLPFGAKSRLIMMHLNSEAVRKQSPEIDVGDSMTAFIKRIGLNTDGRTIAAVKEQLKRLANAQITIGFSGAQRAYQHKSNIISGIDLWFPKNEEQKVFWSSFVRLSDEYFQSLKDHAVPLDERVIAAIKHNPMALDIYTWLTQRTFRIQAGKAAFIPWVSLWEQFGQGYSEVRMFRRDFQKALGLVKTCHNFNVTNIEGKSPTTAAGLQLEFSQSPIYSVNFNPKRLAEAKKLAQENNPNDNKRTRRFKARLQNQVAKRENKK